MLSLALALMPAKPQVPSVAASNWKVVERLTALVGKDADAVHQTLGDPIEIKQGELGEGPGAAGVARFYYVYDTKVPNDERLNAAIVIRKSDRKAIGVQGEARSSSLARDVRNWDACKAALLGPLPWKPLRAYVRPMRTEVADTRCNGAFFVFARRNDGLETSMRAYNPEVTIVQALAYDAKALDFDRTWVWGPTFAPADTDVVAFSIGVPLEAQPGAEPPQTGTLITYAAP